MAWARSAAMPGCATTPRSAERSPCSACRSETRRLNHRPLRRADAYSARRLVHGATTSPPFAKGQAVRTSFVAAALAVVALGTAALADGSGDPAAVKNEDGKYLDKDGNPTFKVGSDGTVDWYTYSGFRRYHSECHVCHGPDGEGSTYAPAL